MFLRAIKNDIASKKNKKSSDYSGWVTLAEQWEAKGNYKWAYLCYVRALRKCKENKELHRAKALCCLKMGKNYMYLNIMKNRVLKSPIPEDFLQDVVQTANLYKESKKLEAACEVLETAFLDMKNGKLAFQLFKALEEIGGYRKIIEIYHSHYQVLKSTELAPELEILYLIAILSTPEFSISNQKEIDRTLQSILRGIAPSRLGLAAKLAQEFYQHHKFIEAEQVYMRLAEFPQPPIFPQVIQMFNEMKEYKKALKMIQIWKKAGNLADRVQIMKHETEISSRLMKPLIKLDTAMDSGSENDQSAAELQKSRKNSMDGSGALLKKHSQTNTIQRVTRSKKFKSEEENDDISEKEEAKLPKKLFAEKGSESFMAAAAEKPAKVIETMEKLVEEWNSEKVKGKHDPRTISNLCDTVENLLAQEAPAFV